MTLTQKAWGHGFALGSIGRQIVGSIAWAICDANREATLRGYEDGVREKQDRERAAAQKAAALDFYRRRRVVVDGVSGYGLGGA